MPELIYPTEAVIDNPILLDSNALKELDAIISEHARHLEERQEQLLKQEIDKGIADLAKPDWPADKVEELRASREAILRRSYSFRRTSPKITIQYRAAKRLEVSSFSAAELHPEIAEDTPIGFNLYLEYNPLELRIRASESGGLRLSVTPDSDPAARTLYAAVRAWLRERGPRRWQQLWVSFGLLSWFMWLCSLTLAVNLAGDPSKAFYKMQAREIIQKGVTVDNQLKAIETALALISDYRSAQSSIIPSWFWIVLVGGFVVCLLLSFRPKCVLGIGRGNETIRRWRLWMKFVFFSVPTFIAATFLWPTVSDLLRNKFLK